MTFVIVSDIHAHTHSVFAKADADGVNSRLRATLNEWERAARTLVDAGGKTMIVGGDIFHTRGTIDPEVLNPVQATVAKIMDMGVTIYAIPGNHDLKSNDTNWLSSQVETLAQTHSDNGHTFEVYNTPTSIKVDGHHLAFVPWRSTTAQVLSDLQVLKDTLADYDTYDVVIHAGIDGVLPFKGDSGITAELLGAFGFRHVWAGHYHNHKDLGHGVVSIGALTHQNWGDVGTKAGFILVSDDGSYKWHDTHAPKFVDISGLDEDAIRLEADGHFVRFRGAPMAAADVDALRKFLLECGAKGVMIDVPKTVATGRASAPSSSAKTLDESVLDFIADRKDLPEHIDREALKRRAAETLARAREVSEDA